jgi:hypothetical protein
VGNHRADQAERVRARDRSGNDYGVRSDILTDGRDRRSFQNALGIAKQCRFPGLGAMSLA